MGAEASRHIKPGSDIFLFRLRSVAPSYLTTEAAVTGDISLACICLYSPVFSSQPGPWGERVCQPWTPTLTPALLTKRTLVDLMALWEEQLLKLLTWEQKLRGDRERFIYFLLAQPPARVYYCLPYSWGTVREELLGIWQGCETFVLLEI